MNTLVASFKQGLMISVFVFIMMVFIDYVNVLTRGKLNSYIKGGQFRQYLAASFLGATPGCLGAFMSVSLYIHGLISFGAIVGCMIATSGDESFVMLALFPFKALFLFGVLFILGIFASYIVDKFVQFFKISVCKSCKSGDVHIYQEGCQLLKLKEILGAIKNLSLERGILIFLMVAFIYSIAAGRIGPSKWGWQKITLLGVLILGFYMILTASHHYLQSHIWKHIFKKHFLKVFLWTFFALLFVGYGLKYWNLESFVKNHMVWILLISVLVGIIPESGPHMIFVMMFAKGLIPFSVLLTSSIVQDGHGMLPLFSYSVKDSLLVKLFNIIIGLGLGSFLYLIGF